METKTQLTRGARYSSGLYVGTTPAGTEWVARANRSGSEVENFAHLCERFDSRYGARLVKLTGIRSQNVLTAAERLAETRDAKVTATTIEASADFFADLATDLRLDADEWAAGSRSIAEECFSQDMDFRFEEAANKRVAKALRRWAAKCERLAS